MYLFCELCLSEVTRSLQLYQFSGQLQGGKELSMIMSLVNTPFAAAEGKGHA